MTLPKLTEEQRKAALEKAAAVRKARGELRASLSRGETTIGDVLGSDDEVVRKTKVSAVVMSLPGYGKARTEEVMRRCGIDSRRRVGGLGARQREALLEMLS